MPTLTQEEGYCIIFTVYSFILCAFPVKLWLINKCLYLCTRLLLQQEQLRSLSPGRQMMQPQQKSLKQVFQQVNKTLTLTSWLLLIRKALDVLIHFCFLIFYYSCVMYFFCPTLQMLLFCILIYFLFLPPLLFVLPQKLSTHPHLFHACFSKTCFILCCGLWRMWSQTMEKVSDRCLSTFSTWFCPFPLFNLGRNECLCVWHLCLFHLILNYMDNYKEICR